jgi:hypothetical protein
VWAPIGSITNRLSSAINLSEPTLALTWWFVPLYVHTYTNETPGSSRYQFYYDFLIPGPKVNTQKLFDKCIINTVPLRISRHKVMRLQGMYVMDPLFVRLNPLKSKILVDRNAKRPLIVGPGRYSIRHFQRLRDIYRVLPCKYRLCR